MIINGGIVVHGGKGRGAWGAVMDGLVRDMRQITEMRFPVFAAGVKAVDSRGRGLVIDYDGVARPIDNLDEPFAKTLLRLIHRKG